LGLALRIFNSGIESTFAETFHYGIVVSCGPHTLYGALCLLADMQEANPICVSACISIGNDGALGIWPHHRHLYSFSWTVHRTGTHQSTCARIVLGLARRLRGTAFVGSSWPSIMIEGRLLAQLGGRHEDERLDVPSSRMTHATYASTAPMTRLHMHRTR
jgi:hypothetical protein